MTSTLIEKQSAVQAVVPSRRIRVIHRDSFGTFDRGDYWGWSAQATWWHQMRGVKGFHKRILYGFCAKAEFPTPPTVEHLPGGRNPRP